MLTFTAATPLTHNLVSPQCLGLQNITGLITHLVFPNAAPWFYDVYGQDAAQPNYEDYPGNPAGLVRVDRILGSEYQAGLKLHWLVPSRVQVTSAAF